MYERIIFKIIRTYRIQDLHSLKIIKQPEFVSILCIHMDEQLVSKIFNTHSF